METSILNVLIGEVVYGFKANRIHRFFENGWFAFIDFSSC